MDRIVHSTAVDIGGGRRGFRSKDTVAGQPGTVLTATHLNAEQEEIVGFIETTGQEPSGDHLNQLTIGVRSQALNYIAAIGGSANALTATLDPVPASWDELLGVPFRAIIANANTTTTPTFVPDGLAGAKTFVRMDGSPLAPGDLKGLKEFLYDGTNVRLIGLAPSSAGRLIGIQIFTTSGTYTPTAGMTFCKVRGTGGGGGGAGATDPSPGAVSLGSSGAAGTYGEASFRADQIGASQPVTIGAGGAGGVATSGGNGGATSLGGLLILPAGTGGTMFNNQFPPTANGNGVASGPATGANIAYRLGAAQATSVAYSASFLLTAQGGEGPLGLGGQGGAVAGSGNVTGSSASGYGAGGGAGGVLARWGNASGGNGTPGILIIEEYGS